MSKSTVQRIRKKSQAARASRLPLWLGLAAIILLSLAGFILWQVSGAGQTGLASEISTAEAYAKREARAFVLDVREPDEWIEYHIPGSTLIPLNELSARLSEIPQDQEIVVVCRSGNRSAAGRDILLQSGFEAVTSMAGGLKQWRSEGYPIVSGP